MKEKTPQFPSPFDARERWVDRIGHDFYDLDQQLTTGLQILLELNEVLPVAREAVRDYIDDVVKGLVKMEALVVRLADLPGAPEAAYGVKEVLEALPGMDPKEHGHETLASLFEEIRHDDAARQGEEGGLAGPAPKKEVLKLVLEPKTLTRESEPPRGKGHEIER